MEKGGESWRFLRDKIKEIVDCLGRGKEGEVNTKDDICFSGFCAEKQRGGDNFVGREN